MKIAYIDHIFHKTTKSNDFLFNLLSKKFKIKKFWNTKWKNRRGVSFSRIRDKGYENIIIFQNFYDPRKLRQKYGFKNIIWIPMADTYEGRLFPFFEAYKGYKIISFSEEVDLKAKLAGAQSLRVRYYMETSKFREKSFRELNIFFWYRKEHINFYQIKTLFKYAQIGKIYIHNHMDPDSKKELCIKKEDISKYNIEIGEWFNNKDEYYRKLDNYNIFIAPRMREGIGLSFLEAMSRGLIVIGNDDVTMNEYIKNGYNGILFDAYYPKPIEKEVLEERRLLELNKNSYREQELGYEKWKENEDKIIEFITSEKTKNVFSLKHTKDEMFSYTPGTSLTLISYLKKKGDKKWRNYLYKIKNSRNSLKVRMEICKLLKYSPFSCEIDYDLLLENETGFLLFLEYVIDYYYGKGGLSKDEKTYLMNILKRKKIELNSNKEYMKIAEAYYILGEYEKSFVLLKKIVKSQNDDYKEKAYFLLGEINRKLGKKNWKTYFRKAINILIREQNKKLKETYMIASMYEKIGKYSRAKYWFKKLLEINEDNRQLSGVFFHLGEIELKFGNRLKATECLKECLKLNPNHKAAKKMLNEIIGSDLSNF